MQIRKASITDYTDALKLVKNTGCDVYAAPLLAKKSAVIAVSIEKIDNRAANILKQDAISCGADAAVSIEVSKFKKGLSNAVLFATAAQLEKIAKKLSLQPFGLKEAAVRLLSIQKSFFEKKRKWAYKNSFINLSKPAVMGIVNMDPNSFSGDGLTDPYKALEQALKFEEDGALIIDIGAESSRPGVKPIDAKTEIKRLIPALKKIKKKLKAPVSVDTYKYETAKAAIDEGADIINDIFSLKRGSGRLARLIADSKTGLILMHMKGVPKNMQKNPFYENCVSEVFEFLQERKTYAESFGIKSEFIAVDPGPGFGKTARHNFELVKNMGVFSSLGAVVGAVSRKRFVKETAGKDISSFAAANLLTVLFGADIIRVHDVKETANALKIMEALRTS
ncbi:MAG: dihydropteroate synthase [Endomicrobium sp.]|jgi:dihydropteroate synthase|nr:dihydropteroate synthase [Endomicrobium sp.]